MRRVERPTRLLLAGLLLAATFAAANGSASSPGAGQTPPPASQQTSPQPTFRTGINFISVDELKAALDRGTRADIIDVRHWENYVAQHIKGARSIPLRTVALRLGEIPKNRLVVFY